MTTHEVPIGIEVRTEPEEDGSLAYIHATVTAGGQNHTASAFIDEEEPSDEEIAEQLLKVASAVAQMHSSGAWMALQRRLAS